jgi:hypothetical protein
MPHHRPESKGPQADFEFVARYLFIILERLDAMALNFANLEAIVQKLIADSAASAGADDAANQAKIDSITAQLMALDASKVAPAPAAPAAA